MLEYIVVAHRLMNAVACSSTASAALSLKEEHSKAQLSYSKERHLKNPRWSLTTYPPPDGPTDGVSQPLSPLSRAQEGPSDAGKHEKTCTQDAAHGQQEISWLRKTRSIACSKHLGLQSKQPPPAILTTIIHNPIGMVGGQRS